MQKHWLTAFLWNLALSATIVAQTADSTDDEPEDLILGFRGKSKYQIVLPDWLATAIAYGLPWVEIGLGLALIAGLVMPLTLAATAIVLLFFTALTAQAWWRGLEIDCGCLDFSALHPTLAALGSPGGATLRNIVLLALTGLLAFLLRRVRRN